MNEIVASEMRGGPAQPAPYVDRRALSEAWYRALFDSRSSAHASSNLARSGLADDAAASETFERRDRTSSLSHAASRATPGTATRVRLLRAAFAAGARARGAKPLDHAALRPAWRSAVWRRTLCRTKLPSGHDVDLLVQQRGDVLRLVAIYDGRSASRVSAALLNARSALLQRGLRVELEAREKGMS